MRSVINRMKYFAAEQRFLEKAAILGRWLKYDPDQPRAPAGRPDGGQWIPWLNGEEQVAPESDQEASVVLAGIYNEVNRAKCDMQYEKDMFQCRFVASARFRSACGEQAMSRFVFCMKDDLLPPLTYYS